MDKEQLKKHWKVITAFKDGEEIQLQDTETLGWIDVGHLPLFSLNREYRIKPKEQIEPEKEFEVGSWYKAVIGRFTFYIKYRKSFGKVIHGETTNCTNIYYPSDYWRNKLMIKNALQNGPITDLSEIQPYLPEGHVDKIVQEVDKVLLAWYAPLQEARFLLGSYLK